MLLGVEGVAPFVAAEGVAQLPDRRRCLAGVDAALFGNRLRYDFLGQGDEFGPAHLFYVLDKFFLDLQHFGNRKTLDFIADAQVHETAGAVEVVVEKCT